MQLEFLRQNIEKYPSVKIHENPAEFFAYGRAGGRTDGRGEADSRSWQFCEHE
jgi:hypothetical protein